MKGNCLVRWGVVMYKAGMRGGNFTNASRAFSLVELLAVMSTGLLLTAASTRLWVGLGASQKGTPRQAALALSTLMDEAMQTSRGLGSPVVVAMAEAQGEAGAPETEVILLRGLRTSDPDIAVAWPVRLGGENLWRREGETRHLNGVTVTAGSGGTFSRQDLSWKVLAIATPAGTWATGPASIDSWAEIQADFPMAIQSNPVKANLQHVTLILHTTSARPTIEMAP